MKTFENFRLLVCAELLLTHWAFYFLFHVIEKTFSLGHDFFRSKIENVDTYAKGPYNSSVNWYKAEVYLPSCDNNCNISTLDRYVGVKQHTCFISCCAYKRSAVYITSPLPSLDNINNNNKYIYIYVN